MNIFSKKTSLIHFAILQAYKSFGEQGLEVLKALKQL
jgi:hypothetical protein